MPINLYPPALPAVRGPVSPKLSPRNDARSQTDGNRRGQITRGRSGGSRATFGIELHVVALGGFDALQAGRDFFSRPSWRLQLAEHDAQLTVSRWMVCRLRLHYRAFNPAALRENQAVAVKERAGDDRLDRVARPRSGGIERRHQASLNHAAVGRLLAYGRGEAQGERLAAEIERMIELGKIDRSRFDVLRVDGKLGLT